MIHYETNDFIPTILFLIFSLNRGTDYYLVASHFRDELLL